MEGRKDDESKQWGSLLDKLAKDNEILKDSKFVDPEVFCESCNPSSGRVIRCDLKKDERGIKRPYCTVCGRQLDHP